MLTPNETKLINALTYLSSEALEPKTKHQEKPHWTHDKLYHHDLFYKIHKTTS